MDKVEAVRAPSAVQQLAAAARTLLRQGELRVVLAGSALLGLAVSFVTPFLSMFGTLEVGMSLTLFGVFMTVRVLGDMVIGTYLSHWSDTLTSRRMLLLVGPFMGALGCTGYAFVRDVWGLLLIGVFVLGVASVTFGQLFAYSRELIDRSEIRANDAPLYLSAIRMCFALAWTVGPALAAWTLRGYSFRGLFLAAGLLYFAFFCLALIGVKRAPKTSKPPAPRALPVSAVLRNPTLVAWTIAFVCVFAAHTISMGNMSLLVLKELGGSESQVGIIFSLAPLFEVPLMLYFGLLATRIDSAKLIRFAMALGIIYYGALSSVHAPWHIYPLQALSAVMVSVTSGVAIAFFQDQLPHHSGTATNVYMNASRIGSTSGFLLFGVLASRYGHRGAYVACALLSATALLATWVLGRGSSRRLA